MYKTIIFFTSLFTICYSEYTLSLNKTVNNIDLINLIKSNTIDITNTTITNTSNMTNMTNMTNTTITNTTGITDTNDNSSNNNIKTGFIIASIVIGLGILTCCYVNKKPKRTNISNPIYNL